MNDLADLRATAKVTITKVDNDTGEVVGIEEQEIILSDEEARTIWQSQQER